MFDLVSGSQYLVALVFVLGLIGVVAMLARRFGLVPTASKSGGRRLGISEVLPLDGRRRLVLVRCDGDEHLLLLGAGSELVVARGIGGAVGKAAVRRDEMTTLAAEAEAMR